MANKEDTLVQYQAVRYNKAVGVLQLTSKRIVWNSDQSSASIVLADIKSFMVSAATGKQAMIKLDMKASAASSSSAPTPPPAIFEFCQSPTSQRDRAASFAERDAFRDLLSDVLRLPSPAAPTPSPPPLQAPSASSSSSGARSSGARPLEHSKLSEMELHARVNLLASDPELKRLHNELVQNKVISDDEFWQARKELLVREEQKVMGQRTGMPSALVADVRPSTQTANELRFSLTPEIIHGIFVEYPAVHQAYLQNVPDKLSEKEFWTRYIKSRYFFRSRGADEAELASASAADVDPIFLGALNTSANLQAESRQKLRNVDPLINLASDDKLPSGFGLYSDTYAKAKETPNKGGGDGSSSSKASGTGRRENILRRFNRHGALVMESADLETLSGGGESDGDRAARVMDELRLKDLDKDSGPEYVPLKLSDLRRYFDGHSSLSSATPAPEPVTRTASSSSWTTISVDDVAASEQTTGPTSASVAEAVGAFVQQTRGWKPDLAKGGLVQDIVAERIQKELTQAAVQLARVNMPGADHEASIQNDLLTQLRSHFSKTGELLRHFWGSFPITSQAAAQRLDRIQAAISQLYDSIDATRKGLGPGEQSTRVGPILTAMCTTLDKAIEFYEQYNQKRSERAAKKPRTSAAASPATSVVVR